MCSTVKERLITFLAYKKIGQKTFAEMIGVSPGYVNAIRVSIQPKTLSKISEVFPDLNISWLITGEGEMLKPTPYQNAENNEGGTAQAQGDGASAEVNTDSAALITIIATYQRQIEQMQADARAEREKLLDDARQEREFLYSLIKNIQSESNK